jgi:aryl-alcohol dehydrogenase-like predicted oxidoreductase
MLLIPGTSSVGHLRENLAVADIQLPGDVVDELSVIGKAA